MTDSHNATPSSNTSASSTVANTGSDATESITESATAASASQAAAASSPASPSPSPSHTPPVSATAPTKPSAPSQVGVWSVSVVALVLAALAAGGSFMMWRQLETVRTDAQQRSDVVLAQAKAATAQASSGLQASQALQARMSMAEAKLSELNLQRTQLEELMLSVSRSRDDTLVQDLESATRFAMQQSSLMGSPNALVATLQAGIERIGRSAQPRLNPVVQAMQADLDRLQEVAGADVPMLVAQLAQLGKQLDTLPMRNMVPPLPHVDSRSTAVANNDSNAPSNASSLPGALTSTVDNTAAPSNSAQQTSTLSGFSALWLDVKNQLGAYWQAWFGNAGQYVAGLVRVRAIDNSDAFFLSPEHAWLLRENLKLRVMSARLALVGAQHGVAAQDLAAVAQSVAQYGQPDAQQVQALLDKLQAVQAGIQGLQVPMPQSTLAALATAAAGR